MDGAAAGRVQQGSHPAAVDGADRIIDRQGRLPLEGHAAFGEISQAKAYRLGDGGGGQTTIQHQA
ncbi:hypothetical protein D3C85_1040470 [compost metagenome]